MQNGNKSHLRQIDKGDLPRIEGGMVIRSETRRPEKRAPVCLRCGEVLIREEQEEGELCFECFDDLRKILGEKE